MGSKFGRVTATPCLFLAAYGLFYYINYVLKSGHPLRPWFGINYWQTAVRKHRRGAIVQLALYQVPGWRYCAEVPDGGANLQLVTPKQASQYSTADKH